MVDAIVEAGARVLGLRGWAAFTTNEVAEVAGVSIGSLYQYFPNKLALVDAIRRRHLEAVLAAMRASSANAEAPERAVVGFVEALIAAHSVEPAMHRALLDEMPRRGRVDAEQLRFEAEYQAQYKALIARHRGVAVQAVDEVSAQVLSATVEGVIHDAARRGTLGLPGLRGELMRLIETYLSGTR